MLAISTLQFALDSINHLVDITNAHPRWDGYFDFFSLAVNNDPAGVAAAGGAGRCGWRGQMRAARCKPERS